MSASDLKSECVRQSCRQLLFYAVGLFTGQAAAVPFCEALGSVCGCVYGWQLTQSLCASKSKGQFISFNVTNTHWHTGTHTYLSLFISECVCVTVCNSLCLEGSGGLGTVWKSHWASSGSSQSHGKQHWPKTTGIVQAAAWPPSITLFRLDIRHQPLP